MAERIVIDWRWTDPRRLLDYYRLESAPTDLSDHYLSIQRLNSIILNDEEPDRYWP